MYNRYIPAEDGTYRREVVSVPPRQPVRQESTNAAAATPPCPPERPCRPPEKPCPQPPCPPPSCKPAAPPHTGPTQPHLPGKDIFSGFDSEDLLILLILLLLMSDCGEDRTTLLLAAALYFLL